MTLASRPRPPAPAGAGSRAAGSHAAGLGAARGHRPGGERIALYSHDTQGLGHLRRNLAIATALVRARGCRVLLVSGCREAGLFSLPAGVDVLTLPGFHKGPDGGYAARSIGLPLSDLVELRSETIRSALAAFAPHALIVDKVPLGACEELVPALADLGRTGATRLVLGLRDVLDDPETVAQEWEGDPAAAVRERYDAVWVYGDRAVYDPVREYGLGPVVETKVSFTGYLGRAASRELAPPDPGHRERVCLCMVGGGQDGFPLARDFALAELPPGASGVLVTGPFMPARERRALQRLAAGHARLEVLELVRDPSQLLSRATDVVAMGGYNTVCELLASGARALIVPRVRPRREQLIRVERMARLGLLDLLHPRDLSPQAVAGWVRAGGGERPRAAIDLGGLARIPALLGDVLDGRPKARSAYAAA